MDLKICSEWAKEMHWLFRNLLQAVNANTATLDIRVATLAKEMLYVTRDTFLRVFIGLEV
jgi:hypothetical protein